MSAPLLSFFGPSRRLTRRAISAEYAATVTPNPDVAELLNIAPLTGDLTLANPAGTPADGQLLQIVLRQDATGGRAVTLGTAYRLPSSSALVNPLAGTPFGTPQAKSLLAIQYDATDAKWDVVTFIPGY